MVPTEVQAGCRRCGWSSSSATPETGHHLLSGRSFRGSSAGGANPQPPSPAAERAPTQKKKSTEKVKGGSGFLPLFVFCWLWKEGRDNGEVNSLRRATSEAYWTHFHCHHRNTSTSTPKKEAHVVPYAAKTVPGSCSTNSPKGGFLIKKKN